MSNIPQPLFLSKS